MRNRLLGGSGEWGPGSGKVPTGVGGDESRQASIWPACLRSGGLECLDGCQCVFTGVKGPLLSHRDGVGAYSFTACHVRRASRAQIMVDADRVAEGGEQCDEMAGWVRNKGV